MRNRDYKIFVPNGYYHAFNRGNNKQPIFLDREDYIFFLFRLKESVFPGTIKSTGRYTRKALPSQAFTLLAYCLMPNHFHLLIRQNGTVPISKLLSKVCTSYSMYFNKKYGRIGQVFQDQFKAIHVDNDSYILWLSAYIHQNPQAAGLVDSLGQWQWSSFLDYTGVRQGKLCDIKFILAMTDNNTSEYKKFVDGSLLKMSERKDIKYLLLDE